MNIIQLFSQHLSSDEMIVDSSQIELFCTDQRNRYQQNVDIVLQPHSVESVRTIMRLCHLHKITVTPQGGNTGLCGGATPTDDKGIVLSLNRLNHLRSISLADNTMEVEAGMILQNVQELALQYNKFFPLDMASRGSCTIGGNVACNAGGLNVLRYGTARDLVLGLEVVLPDGSLLSHLQPLHKNTTGLDSKQLFIGSEGILGIITAVTLKLFAQPKFNKTMWISINHIDEAIVLLQLLRDIMPNELSSFELIADDALKMSQQYQQCTIDIAHKQWHILLELTDSHDLDIKFIDLAEKLLSQNYTDIILAQSEAQSLQLWRLRENISVAQKHYGVSIKHDIALPIHQVAEFISISQQKLKEQFPRAQPIIFGHLGDGSLHYNVFLPPYLDNRAYQFEEQINMIIYGLIIEFSGTIAAEHGIGQLKRQYLKYVRTAEEINLMHSIKQILDPHRIMNPQKVLPE